MKDAIDDFESIEDVIIGDDPGGDPDVIEITIRGRLKKVLNRRSKEETDYDRAMRGIVAWSPRMFEDDDCTCDGVGICMKHVNPEFWDAIGEVREIDAESLEDER